MPPLDNHAVIEQNGVPGLLSPKGFNTAYTEYQGHIVDELNASTAGTMDAIQDQDCARG